MAAAPARSAPARRTAPAGRHRPRVVAGGARGIRWDRVGRIGLLCVLGVIVLLYVGPLHAFWTARGDAATKRAEVARLRHENEVLRARRAALGHVGTIEAEARRLGMVRQTERGFVVRGLPPG